MKRIKQCSIAAVLGCVLAACGHAPATSADSPNPAQMVRARCTGCHQVDGQGGTVGPSLNAIGARLDAEQVRQKLLNPPSGMPSYEGLPADQLDAIATYVAGLE
ncbi:MAG: cytochrome c [Thermodesulfobacteriota bacterium]|jgi:mono/diheme cytochrome c family protein